MRTPILLAIVFALVTFAVPADGAQKTKLKGKGSIDGRRFSFHFTNQSGGAGPVIFETTFGTVTGVIDCLDTDVSLAVIGGNLDVPVSGFTHFLLVVEDGKPNRMPDQLVFVMDTSSFNCDINGQDAADWVDEREPIERGGIVVKIPPT